MYVKVKYTPRSDRGEPLVIHPLIFAGLVLRRSLRPGCYVVATPGAVYNVPISEMDDLPFGESLHE